MRKLDFDDLWKNHLFDYKDGDLLVIDDITRLQLADYENTSLAFVMGVFCMEGRMQCVVEGQECGGNAFVAVAERVVLGDKIEEHGCFLLHTGIEFLAAECLVDLSDATFERVILLVAEERTTSELIAQSLDGFHGILIGGMEFVFLGSFRQTQTLVVVVVKGVESVSVVHHDVEQSLVFVIWYYLLVLNGAACHQHTPPLWRMARCCPSGRLSPRQAMVQRRARPLSI